jgi:hypothetical protein
MMLERDETHRFCCGDHGLRNRVGGVNGLLIGIARQTVSSQMPFALSGTRRWHNFFKPEH